MSTFSRIILLFIVLGVLTSCTENAPTQELAEEEIHATSECREMMVEARQLTTDYHFDEAIVLLDRVLEEARAIDDYWSLADAYATKGRALFMMQRVNDARPYLEEGIIIADYVGNKKAQAEARQWLSQIARIDGDKEKKWEYLNEAITIFEDSNDLEFKAFLSTTRATYLADDRKYPEALSVYFDLIEIYQELDNKKNLAIAFNNIGLVYLSTHQHNDALEYFNKALDINTEIGNKVDMASNMNNVSITLKEKGELEAAISIMHSVIELSEESNMQMSVIRNRYNLGNFYGEMGALEDAQEQFMLGYELSQQLGFEMGMMHHVLGKAHLYSETGQPQMAMDAAEEALEISIRMDDKRIEADAYDILRHHNQMQGNYQEALLYANKYFDLSEELNQATRDTEIQEIKTRFEVDQRQAENELLRANLQYQEVLNRNQMYILIGLVIGIIVCALLIIMILTSQKRLRRAVAELEVQKEHISHKNQELERLNNDRNALLDVVVHDMKNPLSAIEGFVDILKESEASPDDDMVVKMIGESCSRMQGLVHGLLAVKTIERQDISNKYETLAVSEVFEPLLADYRHRAAKKLIIIEEDIKSFTVNTHQEYVRRILDNLVSNAIKFSPTGTVVKISAGPVDHNHWMLKVSDQGPGFSDQDKEKMFKMFEKLSARPTAGESSTGIGLYTIKLLADKLDGHISLKDDDQSGATFICIFPGFVGYNSQNGSPKAIEKESSVEYKRPAV